MIDEQQVMVLQIGAGGMKAWNQILDKKRSIFRISFGEIFGG